MPKRAASVTKPEMRLDHSISMPLYKQLYERLRAQILTGQLQMGARLPSTRALASELGVSRNTTALAYELLLLEGYVESRVGDGTRVARLRWERPPETRGPDSLLTHHVEVAPQTPTLAQRLNPLLTSPYHGEIIGDQSAAGRQVFRLGQPDVTCFPFETWARLVARRARQSLPAVSLYQNAQGYLPLREAIAAHIGITRGVHCSPEQIIITAGSQGALDLLARTLLDQGDVAWVEDPGYLGARGALLAAGAQLAPVPVDAEGMVVHAGRQLYPKARLAVVTPSHQFPTGVTMSLNRRLALLEWAREAQAWIIEDDYDSEYRYSGRPLEALQGLDDMRHVLYIGTFSKVLFPSLRLGYLIVPAELVPGFVAARHFIDVHAPLLDQMALADFITEGHFVRHLRKMRALYAERRDTLVDALTHELGGLLDVTTPEAGLHLAALLPPGVSGKAVASRAAEHGLHIQPVSGSSLRPLAREMLLFGFAGATPDDIRAGVHALAQALSGKERIDLRARE